MENEKKTAAVESKTQISPSRRFTELVVKEFGQGTSSAIQLTDTQKRLVQGYFIVIDRMLKDAENKRVLKNDSNKDHKYDNNIPYDWQHVNMTELALDAVHAARMGLDMQEDAHLYPIPFADKKKGVYNIVLMEGYAGKMYKSLKYALDPPKAVTIEVVYSNDIFKPVKKGRGNICDTYEFEIPSPFERGKPVGGFGYIEYGDAFKNELVMLSIDDIKKRAKNGSAEFWGSEITGKKVQSWENGKKEFVETDGWADEMIRKTIIREVYSKKHIPIDPSKLDDDYQHFAEREVAYAQDEIDAEAEETANATPIDIPPSPIELSAPAEPQSAVEQPAAPSEEYEAPDF